MTFSEPGGVTAFRDLLEEIGNGGVEDLVFALPSGIGWALPLYELALLTAQWLFRRRVAGVAITVVTPEEAPLASFGAPGSRAVAAALERHGVETRTGAQPSLVRDGLLELASGERVSADRVVALPRLVGPGLEGVPSSGEGFVPVDEFGRVAGTARVYAAGDGTSSVVKQGGLAAQQADVVAQAIAYDAGVAVRRTPFRPVLRGVLLTGDQPLYLRSEAAGVHRRSLMGVRPLWWPPAKVAGQYLAPYLAARGIAVPVDGDRDID